MIKHIMLIAFIALLMVACIEKAPAADLKGAVAINPATGQEQARVVGISGGGIQLDRAANTGTKIFLVDVDTWTKGKCGVCHGR